MKFSSGKALSVVKRSIMPNRPYHAQWLLTSKCNYRCRSCNVWRQKPPKEEVDTEYVKQGLDVLRKLGTMEIVLSGGDPLLRDDIDEILDYASRYFITTIYDNGSMALKKIDALRKADFIAISLDTLDEKKFDYIRGVKGAWKNATNAIETLKQAGLPVGVSPTVSQLNLNEILDFTQHYTDLGVPVWFCLYGYDTPGQEQLFGIGKKVDEFEVKDKEMAANVCQALIEMKKQRAGIYITDKTLAALKTFFLTNQKTWKCKALKSFLMIDSQGRVAGCHRKEPVGSILELPSMWDSERLQELRRENYGCSQCTYLCYIFYSLHGNVRSNIGVVWDQWRNVKTLLKRD